MPTVVGVAVATTVGLVVVVLDAGYVIEEPRVLVQVVEVSVSVMVMVVFWPTEGLEMYMDEVDDDVGLGVWETRPPVTEY